MHSFSVSTEKTKSNTYKSNHSSETAKTLYHKTHWSPSRLKIKTQFL